MKIDISRKYDFFEEVYVVVTETIRRKTSCSTCKNTRQVELKNGRKIDCPDCEGGKYTRCHVHRRTSKTTICGIEVSGTKENPVWLYNLIGGGNRYEKSIFKTESEARKYIKDNPK